MQKQRKQKPILTRSQRIAAIALLCLLAGLTAVLLFSKKPEPPEPQEAAVIPVTAISATPELSVLPSPEEASASPAPLPELAMSFQPDQARPLPSDGYRHTVGTEMPLGGTVVANRPLTGVTLSFSCAYNDDEFYPYRYTVTFPAGSNVTRYDLTDANTEQGVSLAAALSMAELHTGVHTVKVIASCAEKKSVELYSARFYAYGTEWQTMQKKEFNGSYDAALSFFRDKERFLYRFQWVNGRYTLADPDWEEHYITDIPGLPEGKSWRCHVDAVPYMEKAIDYMKHTFVRVQGTNGDSGILLLADLVKTYNGCYVSRYTSSLKTVSHHTFGTAIDINAAMTPNLNNAENNTVLAEDVKKHLKYEGIREENGLSYYSYTYDGSYAENWLGVPETCVNYLLYELAFYRAGFLWGHYYRTTSDAMHFTLTEKIYGSHDGKNSLRKVYTYIKE